MRSLIPYIGGKHRISGRLADILHDTGADTLVDVFGGSAAVLLNAGFEKRIYNDADEDLVNLMRVIGDDFLRPRLMRLIRLTPPARSIFEDHYREYLANGFSFRHVTDPAERALRTFYRHQFAFGGKSRTGGFCLSTSDRSAVKEILRYRNGLKRVARLGKFFRTTGIECLDFQDCISMYGRRGNVVLFVDPPYYGKENYYSVRFPRGAHTFLAQQLEGVRASVVCTYYDHPMIRLLYPAVRWNWLPLQGTRNSQRRGAQKNGAVDWVLTRRKK